MIDPPFDIIAYSLHYFNWKMEWAHLLFLVVVELLMMSMSVFYCVDAQAGATANPSFGYTIRENLKATMSVVLVAFFAAFVFMGIFSLYLYHCSYRYGTHHSPLGAATELCHRGVNRQEIDKCPILVYSAVKDLKIGGSALECAVCLSEFQDYDNIRLLPKCHHVFHPDCIDEWLLPHMTCPVCRTTVSSDVSDINTATTTTTSASNTTETEEQQHHVVCDDVATGQGSESDIRVVIPPCEWRVLDKLPRSHSTGHSLVELPEVVDRYTLRLPDHVRRQVLASHGRVLRLAASSDVALPAGVWSSKRVCYRGESNNVAVSMTTPRFVSGGIWGLGSYANDDNWASEARGGGGGVEVHGRRCWTPLRMSFSRVDEGAQKPAHGHLV